MLWLCCLRTANSDLGLSWQVMACASACTYATSHATERDCRCGNDNRQSIVITVRWRSHTPRSLLNRFARATIQNSIRVLPKLTSRRHVSSRKYRSGSHFMLCLTRLEHSYSLVYDTSIGMFKHRLWTGTKLTHRFERGLQLQKHDQKPCKFLS